MPQRIKILAGKRKKPDQRRDDDRAYIIEPDGSLCKERLKSLRHACITMEKLLLNIY